MRISDWSSDVCSSDLYSRVKKVSEMPAVHAKAQNESLTLTDLLPPCAEALPAAESYGAAAQRAVARRAAPGGKVHAALLERQQSSAHGFAWLATSAAPLRALSLRASLLRAARSEECRVWTHFVTPLRT